MRRLLVLLSALAFAGAAAAIDYRSIDAPVAILYDSPSYKGKKLYLIKAQTPVEVVVKLGEWSKVRDAEGTLAWMESKWLSEKRTLAVVAARAELRQSNQAESSVLLTLDKWVGLEFVEPAAAGWVKVRHREGATGYLRANQVWGL